MSAADYTDIVDQGGYQDVSGGDFTPTITWDETGKEGVHIFYGRYLGTKGKVVKGKDKTFHIFIDRHGDEVEAWGAAILDSNLAGAAKAAGLPCDVRIEYLGKNAPTQYGTMAHNFKVGAKPVQEGEL